MYNSNTKIYILTVEKLQIRIQENLIFLLILLTTHQLPLDKPNKFSMPPSPSRKKYICQKRTILHRTLKITEYNMESNKKTELSTLSLHQLEQYCIFCCILHFHLKESCKMLEKLVWKRISKVTSSSDYGIGILDTIYNSQLCHK